MKTILSLYDFTGLWSKPYHDAGYKVIQIDIKHGDDIMDLTLGWVDLQGPIHGILCASPCDEWASSGARWFKEKDADGRTEKARVMVNHTLDLILRAKQNNPSMWWVWENPVGRMNRVVPRMKKYGPKFYFDPCDYGGWLTPPGDNYRKKTALWGEFTAPIKKKVEPIVFTGKSGKTGSWMWASLGGRSERTKELRSATPLGFSKAFFDSNK